jgi:ABC-type nitrate/sulfonate/bicarbonate transport system substrate-binding protein
VIAVDKTFAAEHPDVVVNFLRAHLQATDWINNAKAHPESSDYALLKDVAAGYTQRSPTVLEEALGDVDYKYEIDSAFLESVKAYTGKLFDYGIVSPDRLLEMDYTSVEDFVDRYVSETFLTQAKAKTE